MKSTHLDLTNLREMTDGDKELEAHLFEEFFRSSETLMKDLITAIETGDNEMWRKSAHALKGTAYNLGAQSLGDSCRTAQENLEKEDAAKHNMLNDIQTHYAVVKDSLRKEMGQ